MPSLSIAVGTPLDIRRNKNFKKGKDKKKNYDNSLKCFTISNFNQEKYVVTELDLLIVMS